MSALLQAILDQPADDTVRLIYADWLDEQGQNVRAEFIRVQVELAATERQLEEMGNPDQGETIRTLSRRVGQLQQRTLDIQYYGKSWWSYYGPPEIKVLNWVRGFVERVWCSWQVWDLYGASVCAQQPIRQVTLMPVVHDDVLYIFETRWPRIKFSFW